VYIALALCLHIYTVYYVDLHYGSGWSIVVFFLPGLSQVVLCFVTVVVTDSFFNRYTNLIYSSVIVFSLIRFAFDDVHVALLNRKNRAEKKPDDDVRILKALEFAEKGEYKQACRLFLRLLKDNPLNATACFGVGVCLVKLGKEKFGLGYIEKSAFLGNAEARKYLYDVAGRGEKGALRAL
jgi:hypothetical protein